MELEYIVEVDTVFEFGFPVGLGFFWVCTVTAGYHLCEFESVGVGYFDF